LTPDRAADAAFGTHRVSPVDVLDPGATAEIAVEVPGVRKEGFDVYMFGERLNLKGKKVLNARTPITAFIALNGGVRPGCYGSAC